MPFSAPNFVAKIPFNPPDDIPVHEFIFGEQLGEGRRPIAESKDPFTCGLTGKTYPPSEVAKRIQCLARALGEELECKVDEGSEFDKVIAIFSVNTVGLFVVCGVACS